MVTDCAFTKGYSHNICQDYATTYSPDGYSQIILCDGCSSSKDTDFGARILGNFFSFNLNKYEKNRCIWGIKYISSFLGRKDYSYLDATLLTAICDDKRIKIRVWGDGYFICKHIDGYITINEIIFESGYPFYFSYFLNKERENSFDVKNKNSVNKSYNVDKFFNKIGDTLICYPEKCKCFEFYIPIMECEYIVFISDGLDSFTQKNETQTSKTKEAIDKFDVLKKLISFKNFKGQFVQRRLNAFKKECIQLGWDHYDDLSIAVMANK